MEKKTKKPPLPKARRTGQSVKPIVQTLPDIPKEPVKKRSGIPRLRSASRGMKVKPPPKMNTDLHDEIGSSGKKPQPAARKARERYGAPSVSTGFKQNPGNLSSLVSPEKRITA